MTDLPYIVMTGGLVDLPELRFTPGGKAVINFRLAGKKRIRDAQGQWADGAPIYMNVSAWESLAEHCAETLIRKGQRVTVTGHLAQDHWEKDGVKQSKYVIEADTVAVDLKFAMYEEKQATRAEPATDPWAAQTADAPF